MEIIVLSGHVRIFKQLLVLEISSRLCLIHKLKEIEKIKL